VSKRVSIGCECHETNHFLVFDLDPYDDEKTPLLYINPHMAHDLSFPKRIIQAAKYVLGIFREGDLDSVQIGETEAQTIIDICSEFLEMRRLAKAKWEASKEARNIESWKSIRHLFRPNFEEWDAIGTSYKGDIEE